MQERNLYLMFNNPVPGKEEEYHRWYDGQHLAEILSIPQYYAAQRYELAPRQRPFAERAGYEPKHRFLTVYEWAGDLDSALDDMESYSKTWADKVTPALDWETLMPWIYLERGPRVTKRDFGLGGDDA